MHKERPLGLLQGGAGAQGAGEGALLALVLYRLGDPVPEHHCTVCKVYSVHKYALDLRFFRQLP